MTSRADTGTPINVIVDPQAEGLAIASDWDAIGMRLADSSGVAFANVRVGREALVGEQGDEETFDAWRSAFGLAVWLFYTNYYAGAARGALDYARNYTLTRSRPWITSGVGQASHDPYILELYGQIHIELAAGEALLDRAAGMIDALLARGPGLTEEERARAAIALFTARVAVSRAALDAASRLFEAMGARAASESTGFDRFWRDIRTHTLHHPLAYKVKEIGDYVLNGTWPDYSKGYA